MDRAFFSFVGVLEKLNHQKNLGLHDALSFANTPKQQKHLAIVAFCIHLVFSCLKTLMKDFPLLLKCYPKLVHELDPLSTIYKFREMPMRPQITFNYKKPIKPRYIILIVHLSLFFFVHRVVTPLVRGTLHHLPLHQDIPHRMLAIHNPWVTLHSLLAIHLTQGTLHLSPSHIPQGTLLLLIILLHLAVILQNQIILRLAADIPLPLLVAIHLLQVRRIDAMLLVVFVAFI